MTCERPGQEIHGCLEETEKQPVEGECLGGFEYEGGELLEPYSVERAVEMLTRRRDARLQSYVLLLALFLATVFFLLLGVGLAFGATTGQTTIVAPASSGSDDQTAVEVPITDAGGYFTGTEVEAALQEIGPTMTDARTPTSHVHAAADTTTGTFATPRLGSGTADATTFLRGDQTWATPPAGALTRIVTVDQGGLGDFTSVKDAVDYVTSQSPATATPWVVEVGPGLYPEQPFTIPAKVHVQGISGIGSTDVHFGAENVIYPAPGVTSGSFVTLAGGTMSDMTVYLAGTPTASFTAVQSTMILSALHNVTILIASPSSSYEVVGFWSSSGSTTLDDIVIHQSSSSVSNTKHIKLTGDGHLSMRYSWLMDNNNPVFRAVSHEGTGHAVIFYTRFGYYTGSTYLTDLANVGTGTFHVLASPYRTSTGDITHPHDRWFKTSRGEREAPTASDTPLTIQGATSQTADLARFLDSTGAEIASVDATGAWTGPLSADSVDLAELADGTAGQLITWDSSGEASTVATGSAGEVLTSNGAGTAPTFQVAAGGATTEAELESDLSDVADVYTDLDSHADLTSTGIDADGDGTQEVVAGSGAISFDANDDGVANEMVLNSNAQFVLSYPGYGYPFGEAMRITTTGQTLSFYQSGAGGRAQVYSTNRMTLQGGNGIASIDLADGGESTIKMMDRVVNSPSVATCSDSGDANPGTLFISATTSYVEVTNSDADGCTVSLGEPSSGGQILTLAFVATSGGVVTLSDTAGSANLSADWTPGTGDVLGLVYSLTRNEWLETSRSDN